MNVIVTGGNGFVASALIMRMRSAHQVRVLSRKLSAGIKSVQWSHYTDLVTSNLQRQLEDQNVVIHTAARAHIMNDEVADPLAEYRRVNVDGTLNLARQAAAAGVKRFIFISSIKVNGERTHMDKPFTAEDTPAPEDAYGISKWEAEQGLQQLAAETDMEVVIIRPPLVYGPGVKGNLAALIRLVEKGIPLPLGAIHNKRSLVAVDNLVDLIITCIDHPAAANQTFLVSDGHDVSTTELLQQLAVAMGRPSRLLPVPQALLRLGARALGKGAMADRLLGSLQVDISATQARLDWVPPVSFEEGMQRCFVSDRPV